jgi:hypothetical protein
MSSATWCRGRERTCGWRAVRAIERSPASPLARTARWTSRSAIRACSASPSRGPGTSGPSADGPLAHASAAELAAHDPTLLARREAARLRHGHVRFFLSTGFNHGGIFRRWTFEFAHELQSLGIQHRVWASQRPDGGRYLRLQLPAALEFAFR